MHPILQVLLFVVLPGVFAAALVWLWMVRPLTRVRAAAVKPSEPDAWQLVRWKELGRRHSLERYEFTLGDGSKWRGSHGHWVRYPDAADVYGVFGHESLKTYRFLDRMRSYCTRIEWGDSETMGLREEDTDENRS